MDEADIRKTSKTLNYIDHPLVGPYFAFFIGAWIYLRHYLNLRIILSEFYEFKTVGPYELNWETEQYKCSLSHYISLVLLASLQSLNLFWLWAILRIAYRFVFLNIAEDDRSDNDENELAEEQRLDALAREARQIAEKLDNPQVLLNGSPVEANGNGTRNGNGKASGTQSRVNGITNRKSNGKKS